MEQLCTLLKLRSTVYLSPPNDLETVEMLKNSKNTKDDAY